MTSLKQLFILFFVGFVAAGCGPSSHQGELITVKGEVPVEKMGLSLIHEHVLVDFIGADSTGYHRWERSKVIDRVLPYLMEAKQRGVHTILDCTPAYLGRDPILLKELSEKTSIDILTNTGYYGAVDNKFLPATAFEMSPEELAKVWINEHRNGIEGTGVFPGFIKISVDNDSVLSPIHAKLVKAAALTHKSTGLTIVSHTGGDAAAFAQLKILKEEGVAADAFVWTHAQQGTLDGYFAAAQQGAWVSLDNVNKENEGKSGSINWYVDVLKKMKDKGLLHKVLISHDAGWYNVGQENGGNYRGYTDIFDHLIPALKSNGFLQEDIDQLLTRNPQRAYEVRARPKE